MKLRVFTHNYHLSQNFYFTDGIQLDTTLQHRHILTFEAGEAALGLAGVNPGEALGPIVCVGIPSF